MNKQYLQNLLNDYQPDNTQELVVKQQMLEFLDVCNNCFDRTCMPGHFTASGWILNQTGSKVLLLQHAKLKRWLQLGGHCDGETNVLKVAIKEAQEESGIHAISAVFEQIFDIDMHLIPAMKSDAAHYHFDIRFLLQVTSDAPIIGNHESLAVQWVDPDIATFPTQSPSIIRMLKKSIQHCELLKQPATV